MKRGAEVRATESQERRHILEALGGQSGIRRERLHPYYIFPRAFAQASPKYS